MNAKYISVSWLEGILMTGIMHPLDIINAIKERIFVLSLVGYLKENIKKLGFFFYLATEEEKNSHPTFHSNLKKYKLFD